MRYVMRELQASEYAELQEEFCANIKRIFNEIWRKDLKALILPWNDIDYKVPALNRNSVIPKNKTGMEKFLCYCFIRQNSKAYPKFQLAHEVDFGKILDNKLINQFEQQDESISKHKVQENREERAGFILGSIPDCVSIENLEEALKANDEMKGIDIIIKLDYMPLQGKKRLLFEDRKKSVRCAQVYVGFSKIPLARQKLNAIWGSQNKRGCPLGLEGVFIPCPFSKRFPVTGRTMPRYKSTMSCQKAFLANVQIKPMEGIIGLDYPLTDVYGLTLRQVIMATLTKDKKSLFLYVDQSFGSSINIAFRSEDMQEAQEFIESMPLILSDYFNLRTWTWFNKQTSNKLSGYKWSAEKGLYSQTEDYMYDDLNEFTKKEALQEFTEEDYLNPIEREKLEFEWDFDRITGLNKDGPLDMKSLGTFRSQYKLKDDNESLTSKENNRELNKENDLSKIKLTDEQVAQLLNNTTIKENIAFRKSDKDAEMEDVNKKKRELEEEPPAAKGDLQAGEG